MAALGAALCWAVAGMINVGATRAIGAFAFNRARSVLVFLMLAALASLLGTWDTIRMDQLLVLVLSGVVGMFLGDTALFAALRRLGPRRMAIMYATSAPMTAVLGFLVLGERLGPAGLTGMLLVIAGVIMAIAFARRASDEHEWEQTHGPLAMAVVLGLLAALLQAAGIIIAKPAMVAGVDATAASAVRVGAAALGLLGLGLLPHPALRPLGPLRSSTLLRVALGGFVGMALGMTLLLYALSEGNAGIVATLSSTSPVLMLPVLWLLTRQRPTAGAWWGAALVVAGTALVLNR